MYKVNSELALKLERILKAECLRGVEKQFVDHLKVIDYVITVEGRLRDMGEELPQVSIIQTDKISKHLFGYSVFTLNRVLGRLLSNYILIRLGTPIMGEMSYTYYLNPIYDWDGYYFPDVNRKNLVNNIKLPNDKFYNQFVSNLYQLNFSFFEDRDIKIFNKSLIIDKYSIVKFEDNINNNLGNSGEGSPTPLYKYSIKDYNKEKNEEENESKNPLYSSETQKIDRFKKVKKSTQKWINKFSIYAVQPHEDNRVYHTLTGLKRESRKYIRFGMKEERLFQVDIKAAQLYLAYMKYLKEGGIEEGFGNLLKSKQDIYLSLMEETRYPGTRDQFKIHIMKELLYSSAITMNQNRWAKREIKSRYPKFFNWILDRKKDIDGVKGNSRFALEMSSFEWILIKEILTELYSNYIPALPLHDSVVFPQSIGKGVVLKAFNNTFNKFPIEPKLSYGEI